jgi:hypothetical protein
MATAEVIPTRRSDKDAYEIFSLARLQLEATRMLTFACVPSRLWHERDLILAA